MGDPALLLAVVMFVGFATEAAVGFGSTLIVVSLGAQVVPLTTLLPVFMPLAIGLSLTIVWRQRASINLAFLGQTVLPMMVPGLVVGMGLFRLWHGEALLFLVGVAITGLATIELRRLVGAHTTGAAPAWMIKAALVAAGVVHGLFGTSGPLVVWASTRVLDTKANFRATLALLWLGLNTTLAVGYVVDGTLTASSAGLTAVLVPALVLGYAVGDVLHHKVPERQFRIAVCVLLMGTGAALAVRAFPAVTTMVGGSP